MTAGILVLEGSDGTGKTTLAQHFVDRHGAVYLHHGYFKGADWGRRYLASIRYAARQAHAGRLVVIDRCWLSSDAYGTTYRGASDVPRRGRMLQRILLQHAAVTVLCVPADPEVAPRNHARLAQEREEMYRDTRAVSAWYDDFYNAQPRCPATCYSDVLKIGFPPPGHYWRYDFTVDGQQLERWAAGLLRALKHRRRSQPAWAFETTNLGGYLPTATALLIGDEPGPRAGAVRWPFVSGSETEGCSPWLAEVLNQADILEEDLAWTNANDPQYPGSLEASVTAFPRLRLVALGAKAGERLDKLNLPHVQLAHPQFWKRFHHQESRRYGTSLRNAIYGE